MRQLIVYEHYSLDGVIQGPGGPEEDPANGFGLGGWSQPYGDDVGGQAVLDTLNQPFELLLGRGTYDIWSGYWPTVPEGHAIADVFNRIRKHVATHRPDSLGWHNSHALTGGVVEAVGALKKTPGDDLVSWGSANLLGQLLAAGLVDVIQLFINPVILGPGKRLFDGQSQAAAFQLTRSATTSTGVIIARYERSGEVRTGSFRD